MSINDKWVGFDGMRQNLTGKVTNLMLIFLATYFSINWYSTLFMQRRKKMNRFLTTKRILMYYGMNRNVGFLSHTNRSSQSEKFSCCINPPSQFLQLEDSVCALPENQPLANFFIRRREESCILTPPIKNQNLPYRRKLVFFFVLQGKKVSHLKTRVVRT